MTCLKRRTAARIVTATALVPLTLGALVPRAVAEETIPDRAAASDTLTVYGEQVRPGAPRPGPSTGPAALPLPGGGPGETLAAAPAPTSYPTPVAAEGDRPAPPTAYQRSGKIGWWLLVLLAVVGIAKASDD